MAHRILGFTMPKWGIEMEEGVVREWHAQEGQKVHKGDLFVVIETDKIANDVELEFTGTLRRRIAAEGDIYPVGALLAVFAEDDVPDSEIEQFITSFKPADASFAHKDDGVPVATATATEPPPATETPDTISISPKAADLARRLGVDLARVQGSGRNGRISLQDVEQAAKAQGLYTPDHQDNPYKVIKLTPMRRTIAKRLTQSVQTVPHFYLRTNISMDALQKKRTQERKANEGAPTINDYLIKACAKALMAVPEANIHFLDDEIHQFEHADISVAVAVPGGLVTPVIRRADQKPVKEIACEMRDLADRARAGKLKQHDYRGGTFSLSNLGMFGITSFDAVIDPPICAILAAGAIARRPAETADGGISFSSLMNVTLSCDHRAIDGALGGRFLQALKHTLEAPETL